MASPAIIPDVNPRLRSRPGASSGAAFLAGRGPFAADLPPDLARRRDLVLATPALCDYQRKLWMRSQDALAEVVAQQTSREPSDPAVRALARYVLEIPDIIGMDDDPRAALDAIFGLLATGWVE
jgi:hypothetical protein